MPRHHEIVTEIVAPDWPSFVRKSALRADSFLARLSDTEFDQGMAALRAHGADINPAQAVTEEIDWFVFTKRIAAAVTKARVRIWYETGRFRPMSAPSA
jgi:hypothetical protein